MEGGTEYKMTEVDDLVLQIMGKESLNVKGLGIADSMQNEETLEQIYPSYHRGHKILHYLHHHQRLGFLERELKIVTNTNVSPRKAMYPTRKTSSWNKK